MKKDKKEKTKNKKTESTKKLSKISYLDKYFSDSTSKIKKKDFIIMGILVLIFLIVAVYKLGTFNTPKTYYQFRNEGDEVSLELTTPEQEVSKIRYYTGPEIGDLKIMTSVDGNSYNEVTTVEEKSVFAWEDVTIGESFKYIKFVSDTAGAYLGEVQLYDKYGDKILTKSNDDQSALIIDEMDTVPVQISHINSSYFDEIYFARSAYEYVHGIDTMEWVHPPIGKLIMTIPILLFGMSTFSFRIMGVIAGAIMIPVVYILAKRLFKNRKWAVLAGILMTFDSFHFAQSRIGTVDTYLVLFIMLSSLFMYQYINLDNKASNRKKLINLFLSGLFIGLAISTKWTGLYAGVALAIIFFGHLISKKLEKEKKNLDKLDTYKIILTVLALIGIVPITIYYMTLLFTNISLATTLTVVYAILLVIGFVLYYMIKLDKESYKIILPCIVFFILIPIFIYAFSYFLFPNVSNYSNNSSVINQIKDMYHYHATLTEGHPFSSSWYSWPFMYKPVWYYVGYFGGNMKATIVGIGNPAIWWFGVVAAVYTLISSISKRTKESLFILLFIVCSYFPYYLIDRAMFMYHYYPTLPFIMLAIVSFVKWITDKIKSDSFYIFYVAVVILMFIVFYPIVSGTVTTTDYIDSLKWLSSWIF